MKDHGHIIPPLFGASPSPLRSRSWAFLLTAAAILTLLLSTASSSFAGSATWKASPATGNWNHAANWTPATIPNGPSDTAFFATSNKTAVHLSANTEVDGIVFNSGASAFTITVSPTLTLTISGVGITNNSGIMQNFVAAVDGAGNQGTIQFLNTSTAGDGTFTNNGSPVSSAFGGSTNFLDTSTAGNGTFTNNGGAVNDTTFISNGKTRFFATSTAGSGTFITNGTAVSDAPGGETDFLDTSTAGNGTFTTNGGAVSDASGRNEGTTQFFNTSTAGSGTFTTNGGAVSGAIGGFIQFNDTSTAGNGTFTTNGGAVIGANHGHTQFFNTSTASNATLIANGGPGSPTDLAGGVIRFFDDSTGGTARVEVFGNGTGGDTTNGNLDISFHNAPGVAVGSIEGTGAVFLGANILTAGGNKLSTTFSGVMQDGGRNGGTGGSFTKIGKGKLTFTTANTYTGGTTLSAGTLLVKNKTGSGTGTDAVQVNRGTLSGTGMISGAVTVGTGTSSGAILLAGNSATSPGILTINNTLTFNSLSTYQCVLNRTKGKASTLTALGVTINSNVPFTFVDVGTGTLTVGTIFTVVNNTSANPIFGTFSNLSDGSVFTSNGNNFQVSYTGGTGNDLTLTVVP